MLHVWLIPAIAVALALLAVFYLAVRLTGGGGVRSEGRALVDQQEANEDPPPGFS